MIFFIWVIWFWLLITVFVDLFRRHDLSGWAKAAWAIFVIVLPYLGVFIYLITQGRHMAERNAQDQQAAQAQLDDRIRSVAGSGGGAAAEIEKANQLLTAARSPRPSSTPSSRRRSPSTRPPGLSAARGRTRSRR